MRRAVVLAVVPVALVLVVPALGRDAPGSAAKRRCHTVVKKVHGKKRHIRVCTKRRPKPRPKPKPNPGRDVVRRIDVGGYKLAIECRGTGSPAVVLDSGFSSSRFVWTGVLARVGKTTRICSYDRAGLGESDLRPGGTYVTTGRIVDDLHTLLQRAKVAAPYVLGGWSMGGFDVRYYTHRYPSDVAGLVLVDATPSQWVFDLFDGVLASDLEIMDAGQAAAELEASPGVGSRPLVDLTHGVPLTPSDVPGLSDPEHAWMQEQKDVVHGSTTSVLVRADDVGHDIPEGNPGLVATALTLVTETVRTGYPLPACTVTKLPAAGGTCLDPNAP
jgi:alpha/beta hydrolase fold